MDNAVALVRAYLHVNGYFTVTEYPVLEAVRRGGYRTVTDIDILAVRFARAGESSDPGRHPSLIAPDPMLGLRPGEPDMIMAEVKEGAARMNPNAHDPAVVAATLVRFGCCAAEDASDVVHKLLSRGTTTLPNGHRLRMVVFAGSDVIRAPHSCQVIALGHVIEFLDAFLDRHWSVARHAQFKDDALAFIALARKGGVRLKPSAGGQPSEKVEQEASR